MSPFHGCGRVRCGDSVGVSGSHSLTYSGTVPLRRGLYVSGNYAEWSLHSSCFSYLFALGIWTFSACLVSGSQLFSVLVLRWITRNGEACTVPASVALDTVRTWNLNSTAVCPRTRQSLVHHLGVACGCANLVRLGDTFKTMVPYAARQWIHGILCLSLRRWTAPHFLREGGPRSRVLGMGIDTFTSGFGVCGLFTPSVSSFSGSPLFCMTLHTWTPCFGSRQFRPPSLSIREGMVQAANRWGLLVHGGQMRAFFFGGHVHGDGPIRYITPCAWTLHAHVKGHVKTHHHHHH